MTAVAEPELSADWHEWPVEQKLRFRMVLRRRRMQRQARPEQLAPTTDWRILFLRGGRGSGKTWAGAKAFADEILSDPERTEGEWAIVAPTFADARDKCVESDESGILMALGTSKAEVDARISPIVKTWNRSIGELHFHDGTVIHIDGADDGAYRIQGFNLRGVWCDEVGLWKRWKDAWDESITMALRKGRSRRIATGTPKRSQPARALVKRLLRRAKEEPGVVVERRLRTSDNWDNLSQPFRDEIKPFIGTQLGAQELEGIMLEDAEGALWKREWIEDGRREQLPHAGWQRKPRIGVDLSDGGEESDEQAYTVSALGMDHDLYVIEQEGFRCTPYQFAGKCIDAALRHHGVLVLEKNHGGLWAVDVFERAMKDSGTHVPLEVVHASQSKRTRAEPVASLYEPRHIGDQVLPGRVHHLDIFEELEDQMTNWTGAPGEKSPDRLDSLVWSLWDFIDASFKPYNEYEQVEGAVPYTDAPPRGRDYEPVEAAVPWS